MKQKIKKAFENAVWWSGVVMVGLVLGLTIQFVKAWTEPTQAPPNGNVGAPINTSSITQIKNGILSLVGLSTSYINVPGVVPVAGNVLTAQNALGQVAWAAGTGGASFTYYCNFTGGIVTTNICTNAGGTQGYCPSGFRQIYKLGSWGSCIYDGAAGSYFRPPGGGCPTIGRGYISYTTGEAYVCSQ